MIDLDLQLKDWLREGVISADQAELMRVTALGPPTEEEGGASERRIPLVTEILGYVGAALAIWAVAFLAAEFWANLTDWAQASLFAVLSLVLFVGGVTLLGTKEEALQRLSSVLWTGAVGSLAGALFIIFEPIAGFSMELTWTFIGAIATAVAVGMMWKQPSVLQHIVLFAAALTTIVSLLTLGPEPELFVYGFVVWGFGMAWILIARAGVLPRLNVGMILGGLAMLYGAQIAAIEDTAAFGVLLGLGTAGVLAGAGVLLKEKLTIILGGIGIFMFVPQAMFHFFGEEMGAMFGLFFSGLLIIGLAVMFGRHKEAL